MKKQKSIIHSDLFITSCKLISTLIINSMKKWISMIVLSLSCTGIHAQDNLSSLFTDSSQAPHTPVIATFKSGELINARSNETMHKHDLLFIVAHRFGDMAGSNGGAKTFFGMDNIYDVLIGFEYGISDRFTIGTGRDKGAPNGMNTDQMALYYILLKYRLLQQTTDNHVPFAITLFARGAMSTMKPQDKEGSDANFQGFGDRLSAAAQVIIARKFSESFSLEIVPTYIRRDLVATSEMNDLFALGIGGRLRITPHMAIVADYFVPFRNAESTDYYKQQYDLHFYNPLGVGLEIETGGHIFHINFTNSTSIIESQFVPSTTTTWTKGQFRWGFNLSRTFTLGAHAKKEWHKE